MHSRNAGPVFGAWRRTWTLSWTCLALLTAYQPTVRAADDAGLGALSLAELGDLEVTSVSKSPERLREAAAAIFVITQEEIRRSGATTLVEALRLAPNLRIAQLGANNHVAASRGFGGAVEAQNFSNKLLMLIDGRSVYSPLFSGIYLDTQDLALAAVARIEIISGPGATLWGANAMNGVINVITHPAYLTEGLSMVGTAGPGLLHGTARLGARTGERSAFRVHVKGLRGDASDSAPGVSAEDGWRRGQLGLRGDFTFAPGELTVRADAYDARNDRAGPDAEDMKGASVLARWQHAGEQSRWHVQAYFDHAQREIEMQEGHRVNTWDVEAQQQLNVGARHDIVWGGGIRLHRYRIRNAQNIRFMPDHDMLELYNLFLQDTVAIGSRWRLTAGLKLEHHSNNGWEPQPELRLAWQGSGNLLAWAAVARAIRAPTPFDTDVVEFLGGAPFVTGNPDFRAEELVAWDAGVKFSPASRVSMTVSAFYNDYDDLRSIEYGAPPTFLPLMWGNGMRGHTWGVNAWATWQVTERWRLSPGLELFRRRLRFAADSLSPLDDAQAGNDPGGHATLTSSMDLPHGQAIDFTLRHTAALPGPRLGARTELTARYAWRVSRALELSLRGVNLLHRRHRAYPAPSGNLLGRTVMAEARWRH